MRKYSKNELILLKYADGHNIRDDFPGYFSYKYNLDTNKIIADFLKDGLLNYSSVEFVLSRATTKDIKEFAVLHDIDVKPPKSAMISSLIENISDVEIMNYFTNRYYVLTELGTNYLQNNSDSEDYANRFEPILNGFDCALKLVKKLCFFDVEKTLQKKRA